RSLYLRRLLILLGRGRSLTARREPASADSPGHRFPRRFAVGGRLVGGCRLTFTRQAVQRLLGDDHRVFSQSHEFTGGHPGLSSRERSPQPARDVEKRNDSGLVELKIANGAHQLAAGGDYWRADKGNPLFI